MPDRDPLILAQDRGFLLADGLFETFKIVNGQAVHLQEHMSRLFQGASILGISHDITIDQIVNAMGDLMRANQYTDSVLSARLTLTRGPGPRGISPPVDIAPTVMFTMNPYCEPDERPQTLWVASNRRNEYSSLSNIKSTSYTDNIVAKIHAQQHGADDALFLNTKGFVACTTCANIFIVKNHVLITPPITDGILPGITRAHVIAESKLPVEERSITLDECRAADQIFITNALMGVRSVSRIVVS